MRLLPILAAGCFVSSMSMRLVDPVVPDIARDLHVSAASVALLASAFTFPYALGQPILGALGDALGKARIIKITLALLVACLAAAAFAPSLNALFMQPALSAGQQAAASSRWRLRWLAIASPSPSGRWRSRKS